jgi:RNA polymerase primary sigma factor
MSFETSENLPKYFKTIAKSNPLSLAEEKELTRRIADGDTDALNTLVKHNLKIVVTLANRHIGQGVPIDDLIQEGNLGLIEAARRVKPDTNTRFITYASLWIRKYLNEAVVAHGRIVRLPHNQEYDRYKAKAAGEEVASLSSVEIDAPVGDDNDTTIGDVLLNTKSNIEFEFEFEHTHYTVERALNTLKHRDRQVVEAYFGIGKDFQMPTDIIAERFDLTNVRVSQIINSSVRTMKAYLQWRKDI